MEIEFDPRKRAKTWAERGLDFARAAEVFAGLHLTLEDDRKDYSEPRMQTAGWLDGRIISMRKANEREIKKIQPALDRP